MAEKMEEFKDWEARYPDSGFIKEAASNFDGNLHAAKKATWNKATAYRNSFPGFDSLAQNHRPHNLINAGIKDPDSLLRGNWIMLWDILDYRLGRMDMAESFARRMGLSAPEACKWCKETWMVKISGTADRKLAGEYHEIIFRKVRLFPGPSWSRRRYDKPDWYLSMVCVESGLPKEEIVARLEALRKGELE